MQVLQQSTIRMISVHSALHSPKIQECKMKARQVNTATRFYQNVVCPRGSRCKGISQRYKEHCWSMRHKHAEGHPKFSRCQAQYKVDTSRGKVLQHKLILLRSKCSSLYCVSSASKERLPSSKTGRFKMHAR